VAFWQQLFCPEFDPKRHLIYNTCIEAKKESKMHITTAIAQLQKEAEFLGLGLLETLQDIQKEGSMVYSNKTMQAYRVFTAQGRQLFAPVAE
jgi:hypothetical protein